MAPPCWAAGPSGAQPLSFQQKLDQGDLKSRVFSTKFRPLKSLTFEIESISAAMEMLIPTLISFPCTGKFLGS